MRFVIWIVAASLIVSDGAGAQRPVFVDGWSSETHPAERFAADSTACVAVAAEIATVINKPVAPEFARCIRNREWIPVRRLVPAPSCVPLAFRLIGAAGLPDSGKLGIRLLDDLAETASRTVPELEVFRWKDETIVASINRYGWLDLSRDGMGWETRAFLFELVGPGNGGRLRDAGEQLAGTPVVVSFRPSCFRAFQEPRGWRDPPTPRRVPLDAESNQTYFEFQVEKQVEPIGSTQQVPWPEGLRAKGQGGEVAAQFVVDTLGRVEIGSFKALRTSNEAFEAAVRAHLPQMRFSPAEVKGRKVRQLVQQSFIFNITP